jgi:hypothetical protein
LCYSSPHGTLQGSQADRQEAASAVGATLYDQAVAGEAMGRMIVLITLPFDPANIAPFLVNPPSPHRPCVYVDELDVIA